MVGTGDGAVVETRKIMAKAELFAQLVGRQCDDLLWAVTSRAVIGSSAMMGRASGHGDRDALARQLVQVGLKRAWDLTHQLEGSRRCACHRGWSQPSCEP